MPVRGRGYDEVLRDLYEDGLAWAGGELPWFDAHTHIGSNDPDGATAEAADLLEALDSAGQRRALVFAMHEPGGYHAANDAVLAACAESEGRLVALARLDPNLEPLVEARRALEGGARGFKLHPRSDRFAIDHPAVEEIVALADEERLIVLLHAGRGIPNLGEGTVALARKHPGARIVLAHAGISDLGLVAPAAAELPNLFFDTSWWQPSDLLALYCTVPPGQILYASDMPYGPPLSVGTAMLRCVRQVGLDRDAVRCIAGGQLERLLRGVEPADHGPAPGVDVLGPRDLALERVVSYLTAAIQMTFRGGEPTEALALALLGCQTPSPDAPHAAVLGEAERRIRLAQEIEAEKPRRGIMAALSACLVAATPAAGVPEV